MATTKEDLRRNIEAFKALEPELLASNPGDYAMLYDEELVAVYPDKETARVEAARRYPEGGYAISPAIGSPPATLRAVGPTPDATISSEPARRVTHARRVTQ